MKEWIEKMEKKYQRSKKLIEMMLKLCEDYNLTLEESMQIVEEVLTCEMQHKK